MNMRIRPKAIILDYGNVLSQSQSRADVERMASILDFDGDRFRESYWRFRVAYDEAGLDPVAYWKAVAAGPISEARIEELIRVDGASWSHPALEVPEWVGRLRQAGFQTALLSNMPATVRDYILTCAWLPRFDHLTFSCDLGISKPSRGIYENALRGLGVLPGQALFLDDRPENVRAAEELGIHSILFTALEQVAAELERRFDIPALRVATLEEADENN
jgi:putative hydrolase of the HAD superfamily